jgi:palmitoyltransferase
MIKFLEAQGANSLLLTKLGLNCLHLAAQGDQIASALYFYDKFDINAIDNKKGTALHWAAYIGSDEVTSFLLSQDEI